jgi:hypothetical protein
MKYDDSESKDNNIHSFYLLQSLAKGLSFFRFENVALFFSRILISSIIKSDFCYLSLSLQKNDYIDVLND